MFTLESVEKYEILIEFRSHADTQSFAIRLWWNGIVAHRSTIFAIRSIASLACTPPPTRRMHRVHICHTATLLLCVTASCQDSNFVSIDFLFYHTSLFQVCIVSLSPVASCNTPRSTPTACNIGSRSNCREINSIALLVATSFTTLNLSVFLFVLCSVGNCSSPSGFLFAGKSFCNG
jgi:hypothetical protein